MAYKLQSSAPDLMDLSKESKETLDLYGVDPAKSGYARNCLLARRLIERGVRFVQLFHEAWDQHGNLDKGLRTNCQDTDQATAALITDLKQAGCWKTPWSSGAASSAARRWSRAAATAGTITTAVSRCGWPAAA